MWRSIITFPKTLNGPTPTANCTCFQSRPITSLFPVPARGNATDDLRLFFSFGAVQGVLDPLTPLGQDTLRMAAAGGASLLGYRFNRHTQPLVNRAGERLWLDITGMIRHGFGRKFFLRILPGIEPGAAESLRALLDDPRWSTETDRIASATVERIRPLATTILRRFLANFAQPDKARQAMQWEIETSVAEFRARMAKATTLTQQLDVHSGLAQAFFLLLLPRYLPRILAGYLSFALLMRLGERLAAQDATITPQTALALTRGLPHNVTTEMDLALWETAQTLRQNRESAALIQTGDAADLAARYLAGDLPTHTQRVIEGFLDRYGMRGLAEIDFGRARWRENPTPVIQSLQSYLAIEEADAAPAMVFTRGEKAAEDAIRTLAAAADRAIGAPVGGWLVRMLSKRVRALAGLRESPKFNVIRLMGVSREALLQSGAALVEKGVIDQPDDLFYLYLDELYVLAMDAPGDWKRLVAARRATFEREKRRRPIPRMLLSDGTAIYEGMGAAINADGSLVGSPVSPGVVEGNVRVVFDPHGADLQPGEILVCPGTDPAWTPLFLAAGGLIMEVGGMMTHGSVVAREYGIPAVVGVDRATTRLQTGQRVRVDGTTGRIVLVGETIGD